METVAQGEKKLKKRPVWLLLIFLLSLHELGLFVVSSQGAEGQPATESSPETKSIAEPPPLQMDEIVVSATRTDEAIKDIPKNVTVITSEDIANAPSNNIVDLLRREADINLRSFFGHDGRAGVDIRGMGDTFVSNVIIMVDGYRLNSSDMSGANLSSIPLGRIERIEIVRGGGSVIYGDGAVGGVVNIITKPTPAENGLESGIYSSAGSWNTLDTRAFGRGRRDNFGINIDTSYYDTDGYRDNGYYEKKDAGIDMEWDINTHIIMTSKINLHRDEIGFPGPVSALAAESENDRTKTMAPNDYSETTDNRYHLGFTINGDWGLVDLRGGYRDRNNPYIIGYTPLLSREEQTDEIVEDTGQINLTYKKNFSLNGMDNRFLAGMDYYSTDYLRDDYHTEKKNGSIERLEWFGHDQLRLTKALQFSFGYRGSSFTGDYQDDQYRDFFSELVFIPPVFIPPVFFPVFKPPVFIPPVIIPPKYLYSAWVPGEKRTRNWHNNAYELGLTWDVTKETTLFASHSQSYRIPNVDELALADDDLQPQQGLHWDIGSRYRWHHLAEMTFTLFQMGIDDEIYYGEDPVTSERLNRNYDEKTMRRGMETQIKLYPTSWCTLHANYTYLQAKFEERKTFIPLVPENTTTLGVELYSTTGWTLNLVGNYIGSRYDGNDQDNNQYAKLDHYLTMDGRLTWQQDHYRLFAGVNNILSEKYSTSSYSGSQYPMPLTSVYAGIEYTF